MIDKDFYRKLKGTPITKGSVIDRYFQIGKKWIVKLGLQKEPILPMFEEKGDNMFSFNSVSWNPLNNYWEIHYKYPQNEHTIIHELGHIYLYKLDDNLEYHKKQDLFLAKNEQLWMDVGTFEDLFVERELAKFPEVYKIQTDRARKEPKYLMLIQLFYVIPHFKERVSYIRKMLIKSKRYPQEEINDFLKLRYGKLYK